MLLHQDLNPEELSGVAEAGLLQDACGQSNNRKVGLTEMMEA